MIRDQQWLEASTHGQSHAKVLLPGPQPSPGVSLDQEFGLGRETKHELARRLADAPTPNRARVLARYRETDWPPAKPGKSQTAARRLLATIHATEGILWFSALMLVTRPSRAGSDAHALQRHSIE